ncbi:uncharacterized protein [Montipora foliosa]|uniref:uncharacterized protein isoform X3 n=1 Tax=Montipora foliosa TaxID=591990 RepID=UPI0035F1B999
MNAMRRKTGENEKRRKTIDQKIQYGLDKSSTANFDDCNVQFLDPRERWRKMSIRGLNETDELQRKNARIKTQERKKKICKRNFQIPTIVVTEAL